MTDDKRHSVQLPERAEQWLADWSLSDRNESDWDEMARRITERVNAVDLGSTRDEVLGAPLPARPEEGTRPADAPRISGPRQRTPSPAAGFASLAELARASVAEREASATSLEDLSESLSLSSRARREVAELASSPGSTPPAGAAASGSLPEADEAPASAEQQPPVPSTQQRAASAEARARSGRRGLVVGVASAAMGIAAVAMLWVNRQPGSDAEGVAVATTPSSKAEPKPAAGQTANQPSKASEPAVGPDSEPLQDAQQAPRSVEELELQTRQSEEEVATPLPATRRQTTGSAARKSPRSPSSESEAEQTEEPSESPPAVAQGSEAPPEEAPPIGKPAFGRQGMVEKPSTGAIQAALGRVLGGARACVSGHTEPSTAVVTFGSDGKVQKVAVSGHAAGSPAEGCIRTALSSARVQPFARTTFSVKTTVRPD